MSSDIRRTRSKRANRARGVSHRGAGPARPTVLPGIEWLESRVLLSVNATLTQGILDIGLTAAGDTATVSVVASNVDVFDGNTHTDFPTSAVMGIDAQGDNSANQTVIFDSAVSLAQALTTSQLTTVTLNGSYTVQSADVAASTISLDGGALLASGDVTLLASDTETGASATASGQVEMAGGVIHGAVISIQSNSTVTAQSVGSTLEQNNLQSTASIAITGASQIVGSGDVTIAAASSVQGTASAASASSGSETLDADVANSQVSSTAVAQVAGSTTISAGGTFTLSSSNLINITTTADGTAGGSGAAGGSVALAVINDVTTASVDGTAAITAAGISVNATSSSTTATSASATAGGATQNDPSTETDLQNYKAKTNDGPVTVVGALAITDLTRQTTATIDSSGAIDAANKTNIVIDASSPTSSTSQADGSPVTGTSGVGVSVAINLVHGTSTAQVGGSANLTAQAINIGAMTAGTDQFGASSTSGAGATNVGVAGRWP